MRILYVLTSIYEFVNFSFEVDSIMTDARGNDVTVLMCDNSCGKCGGNPMGIGLICKKCQKISRSIIQSIPNVKMLKMRDYYNAAIKHQSYEYRSLKELNHIVYKDFEIGYGISSYYISLTRNQNPLITHKLKRIFDDWLDCSMKYTDIADCAITSDYDRIYIVNGRYFNSKPFQEVAFSKGLYIIMGESAINLLGRYVRMNFNNVRVHSVTGNTQNILKFWDDSKVAIEKRREIATSFFEKRINAIATNDKVYVKSQVKGMMPDDWDSNKQNIAIFNSSEDERAAIGGEFEKNNLFESQIEGVKFLIDNVKDSNIHFYLRIHPNLKHIKYKYHLNLHKLSENHDNITIIPGDSSISSYTLMQASDRIITFGSTMGVEAAYAGKEVMVMNPCFYYYLDVNYVPKSKQDVLDFVKGKISYSSNHENVLKYSYYYFNDERGFIDNKECEIKIRNIRFFVRRFKIASMNYLCSEREMKWCVFLYLIGISIAKIFIPKKEM